jgi:hypothetical protein
MASLTPGGRTPGLAAMALLLAGCLGVIAVGHLDEDAYILFTYSTNLATGQGIVWDHVHGHAEGATDFLWMVLVAALQWLGLDAGAAAGVLNALGLGMAYFAIARVAELQTLSLRVLLALTLLVSHVTAAALGGFSTQFYAGVFLSCVSLAVARRYRGLAFALLALGLVRPDGVLLAVGTLAVVAWREPKAVGQAWGAYLAALALGLGYFLWRWHYFGLLLPLPLLVKRHALSIVAGLRWNLLPLLPLVGFIALMVWRRAELGGRTALALGGPALLFVALSLANQMQNLSFRFQAPMSVAILMLGFAAGHGRPLWLAAACLPSLAFGVRAIDRELSLVVRQDYVNYFPQALNPWLGSEGRLALTEAGRFGLRMDAAKLDLVGLNSADTATGHDRVAALARFAPDLIFEHQVWTLDVRGLDLHRGWIELSLPEFLGLPVLDRPGDAYHTDPTHEAAMAARTFVASTPDPYRIYAVEYRGEYSHFYFLREGGRLAQADFERSLSASREPGARRSHCAYSQAFPCPWLVPSAAGIP